VNQDKFEKTTYFAYDLISVYDVVGQGKFVVRKYFFRRFWYRAPSKTWSAVQIGRIAQMRQRWLEHYVAACWKSVRNQNHLQVKSVKCKIGATP